MKESSSEIFHNDSLKSRSLISEMPEQSEILSHLDKEVSEALRSLETERRKQMNEISHLRGELKTLKESNFTRQSPLQFSANSNKSNIAEKISQFQSTDLLKVKPYTQRNVTSTFDCKSELDKYSAVKERARLQEEEFIQLKIENEYLRRDLETEKATKLILERQYYEDLELVQGNLIKKEAQLNLLRHEMDELKLELIEKAKNLEEQKKHIIFLENNLVKNQKPKESLDSPYVSQVLNDILHAGRLLLPTLSPADIQTLDIKEKINCLNKLFKALIQFPKLGKVESPIREKAQHTKEISCLEDDKKILVEKITFLEKELKYMRERNRPEIDKLIGQIEVLEKELSLVTKKKTKKVTTKNKGKKISKK